MEKVTRTVLIEGEAAEKLAELAALSGRSEDWFANFMICEYAGEELRIVREIQVGLDSMKAGQGIPHEEVMARMDALLDAAEASETSRKARTAAR